MSLSDETYKKPQPIIITNSREDIFSSKNESEPKMLTDDQKQEIEDIFLDIKEIPQEFLEYYASFLFEGLENGNKLNRILTDESGKITAFLVCTEEPEYDGLSVIALGSNYDANLNLFDQMPDFYLKAKELGYKKVFMRGQNDRLNSILEKRYGWETLPPDTQAQLGLGQQVVKNLA